MCGVLVWLNRRGEVEVPLFARSLGLLRHRGPDAQRLLPIRSLAEAPRAQVVALDGPLPGGRLLAAAGHTRLSILDLSEAAHQPFVSPDGRHCLVYNGEIYNYREERQRLGLEGRCRTAGDTEVLFQALIRQGPSCLKTMNGMWAFAFFDFTRREMLLSRDQLGKKPLFLYHDADNFIAASEMKSIFAILGARRRVEPSMLAGFLLGKLPPTFEDGRTFYRDVRFLPAGANLHFNLERFTFEITRENDLDHWLNREASTEEFAAEVEQAVTLRLRSDVPIAIPVSGGVDSSLVAACAVKSAAVASPITFYTVLNFDDQGEPRPDLAYARRLTRELGVPLTEIELPLDEASILRQFRLMTEAYEFPINPFLISWSTYLMNQEMAGDGIRVLLDGTGGDEVLGGYPGSFATLAENLAANGRVGRSAAAWRRYQQYRGGGAVEQAAGYVRLLRLALKVRERSRPPEEELLHRYSRYFRDGPWGSESRELLADFFIRDRVTSMAEMQRFEIRNWLLPYGLYVNDQNAMLWSMENRSPLLDVNLLKYVNLPDRRKMYQGFNKHFLRLAMPPSVPDDIRWRRAKHGMGISPDYFFHRQRKLVEEQVADSPLVGEIVRMDRIHSDLASGRMDEAVLRGLFSVALIGHAFDCTAA